MSIERPRRRRKGDRLLNPDATSRQIECDYALAPFDEASRAMDRKWGIDRLPALVSEDTAQKFGRTIARLNSAIESENPEEVSRIAASARRGLAVMDAEAEANGAQPVSPKFISAEFNGKIITVVPEIVDLQKYEKQKNEAVFTIREIAVTMRALDLDGGIVARVRETFPGAEISGIQKRLPNDFWKHGDEIPI